MALARLHVRIPVIDAEGDKVTGASVKFYQPGTASVSGVTTTGTPFAGNLYAAVSGGSPVSTTQTSDANGEVVIYTDTKSRFDVGIEIGGASPAARVASYETFEIDPADVMTSASGEQSVIQTGTLAAPSLAQTGNLDTGFNVDADGDPGISRNTVGVLETTSTVTTLRAPNGSFLASIGNTTGFIAPDLVRWYNATNNVFGSGYQITEESTATSTNAAANTTALEALWTAVATAGGGTIYIPRNSTGFHYAFNTTDLAHDLGYSVTMNLLGDANATLLRFYGTSGNLLDIASNSNSLITRGFIRDLTIYNGSDMTAGSTIRLGGVTNYTIENVHMPFTTAATQAFTNLTLGNGSLVCSGITLRDCKLVSNERANSGAIRTAGSGANGGYVFENCALEGHDTANSVGILFGHTALLDGVQITHCGIGTAKYGIWNAATATANVLIQQTYFDNLSTNALLVDATGTTAAGGVINWLLSGNWIASTGNYIELTEGALGTLDNVIVVGNYMTNALATAVVANSGVSNVILGNNIMGATMAGAGAPVDFLGVTNFTISGNIITAGGSATSSIRIDAACDAFTVGPNVLRGLDISYAGALSESRVILDRAFKA